jgi:hypothetical protein
MLKNHVMRGKFKIEKPKPPILGYFQAAKKTKG